jgi:hypothetical protein
MRQTFTHSGAFKTPTLAILHPNVSRIAARGAGRPGPDQMIESMKQRYQKIPNIE